MKVIILLLAAVSAVQYKAMSHARSINLGEEMGQSLDDDIDSLMQKYDDDNKKKPAPKTASQKSSGVSAGQVQDMEYKILSTGVLAESSQKADDDDLF
jgi:hypothetical protein